MLTQILNIYLKLHIYICKLNNFMFYIIYPSKKTSVKMATVVG